MQRANHESLKYILAIIRRTTKIIKVFPFLYIVLFLVVMPIECYAEYSVDISLSYLFFESPLMIAFLILLSYTVKLCKWHRLQCALPLLPQIADFVDTHLYEYGEALATFNFAILILLFILSLVNAYFVFIKPSSNRAILIPKTYSR